MTQSMTMTGYRISRGSINALTISLMQLMSMKSMSTTLMKKAV